MINPSSGNDKIAGQYVTVFDYPDRRFKIRHKGREVPYAVGDGARRSAGEQRAAE